MVIIVDSSDSRVTMAGKRSVDRKGKAESSASNPTPVPDVYQEMLAEVLPKDQGVSERPLKRRRRSQNNPSVLVGSAKEPIEIESPNDEDQEFEDVMYASDTPSNGNYDGTESNSKRVQTAYRDSEDESEDSDLEWEGIDLDATKQRDMLRGDLELTLTSKSPPPRQTSTSKRRTVTKADKELRLQIHKFHVLCLLSYIDRRNHWCNDPDVQKLLRPLINKKLLTFLRPKTALSQFGQAESLKRGLDDLSRLWRTRFSITARGIRRSLWAEIEKDLDGVSFSSFPYPSFFAY